MAGTDELGRNEPDDSETIGIKEANMGMETLNGFLEYGTFENAKN